MPRPLAEIRADIAQTRRDLDSLPESASRRGLDQDFLDKLDGLLEEEQEALATGEA
jgi:hypothetical protein